MIKRVTKNVVDMSAISLKDRETKRGTLYWRWTVNKQITVVSTHRCELPRRKMAYSKSINQPNIQVRLACGGRFGDLQTLLPPRHAPVGPKQRRWPSATYLIAPCLLLQINKLSPSFKARKTNSPRPTICGLLQGRVIVHCCSQEKRLQQRRLSLSGLQRPSPASLGISNTPGACGVQSVAGVGLPLHHHISALHPLFLFQHSSQLIGAAIVPSK